LRNYSIRRSGVTYWLDRPCYLRVAQNGLTACAWRKTASPPPTKRLEED